MVEQVLQHISDSNGSIHKRRMLKTSCVVTSAAFMAQLEQKDAEEAAKEAKQNAAKAAKAAKLQDGGSSAAATAGTTTAAPAGRRSKGKKAVCASAAASRRASTTVGRQFGSESLTQLQELPKQLSRRMSLVLLLRGVQVAPSQLRQAPAEVERRSRVRDAPLISPHEVEDTPDEDSSDSAAADQASPAHKRACTRGGPKAELSTHCSMGEIATATCIDAEALLRASR